MRESALVLYKSLVKDRLSPGLRELGFIGSSGSYALSGAPPFALLGLRGWRYNSEAETMFRAYLLVAPERDYQSLREEEPFRPVRPKPHTEYFDRFPQLMVKPRVALPDGYEGYVGWWRITTPESSVEVAEDFLTVMKTEGLPWMRTELAKRG